MTALDNLVSSPPTQAAEATRDVRAARSLPDGQAPAAGRTFHSILFLDPRDRSAIERTDVPEFFVDLNLDQVVDGITIGKEEYDLKPFFYMPLPDSDAIHYRHEVMQDLERREIYATITLFAEQMRKMREHLQQSAKFYYPKQKQRWFIDAIDIYCDAVDVLAHDLALADPRSRGLLAFVEYLAGYVTSDRFNALRAETKKVKADLSSIRYCLDIHSSSIRVRKYEGEPDYSAEVLQTFEKFKQAHSKGSAEPAPTYLEMDHVEAGVLDLVGKLYPEIFAALQSHCLVNQDFRDPRIVGFDREIQFYISYLSYIAALRRAGLRFCYPRISEKSKAVYDRDAFDLALASKLVREGNQVVCNSFHLEGKERIFVVTGANQGGKTTFARTFGQVHYMARLGCLVPGGEAQLFLFDQLFTHFERGENVMDHRGKLEDDLIRIHEILRTATSDSVIIMNEIFTSTTLTDAVSLSRRILEEIMRLDALGVCVTFIDELASLGEQTVSLVSGVNPENPAVRTFRIERRPADGLAHALAIAQKYRLSQAQIRERVAS
jgi:DNA mismatch repair protein MutS